MENNIRFAPFKVKDIFDSIEKCKCNNVSVLNAGTYQYIGATNRNNGLMAFVDDDKKITKGNCIVFICDGQGSVGYSLYKESDFIGSTTLKVGRYKSINRYNALYIVTALDKNRSIYSYGYKRTEGRLRNETIFLPVNINNEIDYSYMAEVMKKKELRNKSHYISYCKGELSLMKSVMLQSLIEIDWKPFYINTVFIAPQRGKRIVEKNHIEGSTPLVSSYGQGNGVTNFIGNEEKVKKFTDCISIANGGSSAGKAFYHPYTFTAADHVTQCWSKDLNKYQYLFLATVMTKALTGKYSFSHEISDLRLAKERIMLPTTESGEPDYEYMEKYIKNLMIKKYQSYLDYMDN